MLMYIQHVFLLASFSCFHTMHMTNNLQINVRATLIYGLSPLPCRDVMSARAHTYTHHVRFNFLSIFFSSLSLTIQIFSFALYRLNGIHGQASECREFVAYTLMHTPTQLLSHSKSMFATLASTLTRQIIQYGTAYTYIDSIAQFSE